MLLGFCFRFLLQLFFFSSRSTWRPNVLTSYVSFSIVLGSISRVLISTLQCRCLIWVYFFIFIFWSIRFCRSLLYPCFTAFVILNFEFLLLEKIPWPRFLNRGICSTLFQCKLSQDWEEVIQGSCHWWRRSQGESLGHRQAQCHTGNYFLLSLSLLFWFPPFS